MKIKYVIYNNEAYPFYDDGEIRSLLCKSAIFSHNGLLRIRTGKPDKHGYYNAITIHRNNCIFVHEGEEEKYAEYLI
jgi:hypothetical protein